MDDCNPSSIAGLCVCSSSNPSLVFFIALDTSYTTVSPFSDGESDPLSKGINNAKIKIRTDSPNNLDEISVMTLRITNTPGWLAKLKPAPS
jgi:hypothetical protein